MQGIPFIVANTITLTGLPQAPANQSELAIILGIIFGLLGALALLMIVVSGLRYIVSAGDAQTAAKAKNGILYSCVGLVIAIAAEVIVQFVVVRL